MKVILPIVAVEFNDHVSAGNEKGFKDIQKNPLKTVLATVYGIKTYEDDHIITVSSETFDYERDKKTQFNFDRHTTIVKSCIIKIDTLDQINIEVEDDESS